MSDTLARERATGALDVSIALSAGAGTGKTTVLVQRILGLLRRGTPPDRVVAITFTEKAAGEILARTRDELERAARTDPRLADALGRFGELRVGTIHSFCKDLLEAEALAAGWAPRVDIDTLPTEASAADVAFARWRGDFERREPQLGRLLRLLRARTRKGAAVLATFRDLDPIAHEGPFDQVAAFAALQDVAANLETAAGACLEPDDDKLLAGNRALRAALTEAVGHADPWDGLLRILAGDPGTRRSGGRKQDWLPDGKEGFLQALGGYESWRGNLLSQVHGVVVRDLHLRYLPLLREEKARAGVAEFEDLLFRALELVEHDGPRARLAARFDAILVDEVQDTDPIQARVAALLTRDPLSRGPWSEVPPRPGALFAVGDPKQSIYRFRRADVRTWAELEALVALDGERGALTRNFRSVPGIVDWVNHTFCGFPGYEPLVATRAPAELDPVVQLVADDGVEALVRHLLDLGRRGARVHDPVSKEHRALRWRDVMVLLPAWTHAETVREALERAGIPALVEGGGAFFDRDEVRLSLAALRAIDEPADAEAVVFALRGLFGFSHADLAAHVAAGGSWRTTLPTHPPGPIGLALALLRDLHGERSRRGQVELLDAVLEHTRAPVVWSLRADGLSRLANLDKLRAIVREIEPTARTPGEVVERLVALAEDGKEEDLSRSDVDADVVRVTSYFKAKGLEAPVVALVRVSRNAQAVDWVVDGGRVAVQLGAGLEPHGWEALKEQERRADQEERARWMYVAATRARDQLVVVHVPPTKDKLLTDTPMVRGLVGDEALGAVAHDERVALAEGVHVRVRREADLAEPPARNEVFPGLDAAVDAAVAAPRSAADASASRRARVRDAVRQSARHSRRWRSVHELAVRSRVFGDRDGLGKQGGTVVHEVMQRLDLSRPREELLVTFPELLVAVAQARRLDPELTDRCAGVVRRLLADPVLDLARAAPERWQEAPFVFTDRGRAVSGTIDLCFPLDDARKRWMVVDWKSSLPPVGSPLRDDYQRQLEWYAKALLATVGAEEVETRLVGPHPELGATSAAEQALEAVRDVLAAGLLGLLDRGATVPLVGMDVGKPVIAELELAWPEQKVGLGLDLTDADVGAVRDLGWTVVSVATDRVGWPEEAVARLAATLGLATEEDA